MRAAVSAIWTGAIAWRPAKADGKVANALARRGEQMTGLKISVVALISLSTMLNACVTTEPLQANASARDEWANGKQLNFRLASGVYGCELGRKVEIQRDVRYANSIELNWQGSRYTLQRYDSTSGLPRYEDRKNGLLWIDLPWKGVLMDTNSGQPLANECKVARS